MSGQDEATRAGANEAEVAEPLSEEVDPHGRMRRFFARALALALLLSLRYLLALFGAVAFVIGLILAWRADAATVTLIVGAVLLGLAFLLAPGWQSIGASGAGWGFWVQREAEQARRAIEDVAAQENLPEDAKRKLEDAGDRLAGVAETAETLQRTAESPSFASSGVRDRLVQQLMNLREAQQRRGGTFLLSPQHRVAAGAVTLTLDLATLPATHVACAVVDPHGRRTSSRTVKRTTTWGPVTFTYPDDFKGARKLEDGHYRVEWYVPQTDLAAMLVNPVLGILVRDSFEIRGGREVRPDESSITPSR